MTRNFIFTAILTVLAFTNAFGQTPTPSPTPEAITPPSLDTILSEAEKQTENYRETFKNLLADERKTFERYDKSGGTKEQRTVESTFLVYQSTKKQDVSSELRNVIRVDGKDVPDSQKRSEQLLAELQKTTTLRKELEKIQSEGSKYDKTLEVGGLTISEAGVLANHVRPYFNFKLIGMENYQGNDVYAVSYQQIKKSPYIALNEKSADPDKLTYDFRLNVPGDLKNSDALLRGKLWIDVKTFQLWREERELTVQGTEPIVLLTTTLDYQPSDYGILVPKQISVLSNEVKKNSNQYEAMKDTKVNFDYSKFRKTETDVKIIDDPE